MPIDSSIFAGLRDALENDWPSIARPEANQRHPGRAMLGAPANPPLVNEPDRHEINVLLEPVEGDFHTK